VLQTIGTWNDYSNKESGINSFQIFVTLRILKLLRVKHSATYDIINLYVLLTTSGDSEIRH